MKKPRPTKFIPGYKLTVPYDLVAIHRSSTPFVYWMGRPRHTAWMVNMSFLAIVNLIDRGALVSCATNPNYQSKEKINEIPF